MKGQQIIYSLEELAYIEKNKTLSRKSLQEIFCNKFKRYDVNQKNLSALCKRKGWLTGRTGSFEKGGIPWNFGKIGYMGPNKTTFKKGNRPTNWKPVGTERIGKDGYVEIKTEEPKTWELKHRVIWEKRRGPVKKGHIIIFLDGNKQNCDIDNLHQISRAVNAQLNRDGYGNLTGDLRISASKLKELELKINSIKKP